MTQSSLDLSGVSGRSIQQKAPYVLRNFEQSAKVSRQALSVYVAKNVSRMVIKRPSWD